MRVLLSSRLGLIALLAATPALAQHGDWCACGRHNTEPATFQIDHTQSVWQGEAATAFNRWDAYSNVFTPVSGNGAGGSNGINEIIFFGPATTLSQYGIVIDTFTFGVTYINPWSAFGDPPFNECPAPAGTTCGFYSETDVIMNAEFHRGWTNASPNYSDTGPATYLATALHEMGHALGIHHNFDSVTTMNYYEDYATEYLSLSDGGAARGNHVSQARTTSDIGIYPFRFSGFQYAGSTVASAASPTVDQGGTLQLRNFTIENVGSETLSDVRYRFYLSSNDIISTFDHHIGTLSWSTFSTWWDSTGTNFTVPASVPAGDYFIGAIASINDTGVDGITYNNSWVLDTSRKVTVLAVCTPDTFETDDSSGQAKPIGSGVPKDHSICPVGDEDWSTFTLTTESEVMLETSGPTGDTRMWLYNSGLGQIEFDDDGGPALFSFIDRTCGVDALPAGTYYIKIDEFGDNDPIEDYSLSLTATACPCTPDAWETDDTSGQATPLTPGVLKNHNICPVGDQDWSTFTVTTESEVTLETSGPVGDTRMWLYDSGLGQIEFDDDDGSGLFSFIDRSCGVDALPAGTYYVKVDEFEGNEEIESYSLSLATSACGSGCPPDVVLANQTLNSPGDHHATVSVTLGPDLTCSATIGVHAPIVSFIADVTISGDFTAGNSPSCP